MSMKTPKSIKELLAAESPSARPSIELAKVLLKPVLGDGQDDATGFDIMEHDSHPTYCPSFDEVFNWAMKSLSEADPSRDGMDQNQAVEIDDISPALNEYAAGRISFEQLIEDVAKNFSFIDDDAVFGGTAVMKRWHAARISREALRIHNFNSKTADAVCAVPLAKLAHAIQQLEGLQSGQKIQTIKMGTTEELDRAIEGMLHLIGRMPQMVNAALRMGFLYRDAWWIENHGESTVKGYLSQLRAAKAGESGGKQSSNMRMRRIRYFMAELARLISENPILRDDPPEHVAYRAIKLAAKKHPDAQKRCFKKNSAGILG